MVSVCPKEDDPRPKVSKFVSDPSEICIGGLIVEGLAVLMDVVEEEVRKQNPDSLVLVLDKETMVDNHVMTTNDFRKFLSAVDWHKTRAVIIRDDICIIRWPEAFDIADPVPVIYTGGYGCRAVPMCTKVVNINKNR